MTFTKIPALSASLLVAICLSSCFPQVYIPLAPSAPFLQRRGDLAFSGHLSIGTPANASIAYAFADNFAFLAEGNAGGVRAGDGQGHVWLGGNIALGYHSNITDSLRLELYAGVGKGIGSGKQVEKPDLCFFCFQENWQETRDTELATSNIFAVLSLGYRVKMLSIIANARASFVRVDKFDTKWERREEDIQVASSWQSAHASFFSYEGTMMLRINGAWGLDPFIYLMLAVPHPRTILDEDHYLAGNLGFGFRYRFNLLE